MTEFDQFLPRASSSMLAFFWGQLTRLGSSTSRTMVLRTTAYRPAITIVTKATCVSKGRCCGHFAKRHRASSRPGVGHWTDLAVGSKRRDNFYGCWPRSGARCSSFVWGLYATREAKARLRGSLRLCFVETSSQLWVSVYSLH